MEVFECVCVCVYGVLPAGCAESFFLVDVIGRCSGSVLMILFAMLRRRGT